MNDKPLLGRGFRRVNRKILALSIVALSFFILGLTFQGKSTDVDKPTYIDYKGEIVIGDYFFNLKEDLERKKNLVGETNVSVGGYCIEDYCYIPPFQGEEKENFHKVNLESGRTLGSIYQTCVHEVTHTKYPWMRHPWWNWFIETHGENKYQEVCVELVAELKHRQLKN